jgi:RNA polymerase sigma factor (sigma-70 family)
MCEPLKNWLGHMFRTVVSPTTEDQPDADSALEMGARRVPGFATRATWPPTTSDETCQALKEIILELPERERAVLALRRGVDCNPHSLNAIGAMLGVSSERVRQIEADAIRRLNREYSS